MFWSDSGFTLGARNVIKIHFSAILTKTWFFVQLAPWGSQEGSREGPETCVGRPSGFTRVPRISRARPSNFIRGPREGGLGPLEAFWRGPGSAKVRQGFNCDGKAGLILTFSFFAPSGFWQVPRGSRKRVRRPRRPPRRPLERGQGPKGSPRRAQNDRSSFYWAPGGGQIGASVEKLAPDK